jgi:hypothetical protein
MPSFDAQWTAGVTIEPFEDPEVPEVRPGRLNPRQAISPLHAVGRPGAKVELSAVVAGVAGPLDADIASTFLCRIIEWPHWPGGYRPDLYSPVGQSSVHWFVPHALGHYTVCMLRDGGTKGRFIAHLDVEP